MAGQEDSIGGGGYLLAGMAIGLAMYFVINYRYALHWSSFAAGASTLSRRRPPTIPSGRAARSTRARRMSSKAFAARSRRGV